MKVLVLASSVSGTLSSIRVNGVAYSGGTLVADDATLAEVKDRLHHDDLMDITIQDVLDSIDASVKSSSDTKTKDSEGKKSSLLAMREDSQVSRNDYDRLKTKSQKPPMGWRSW